MLVAVSILLACTIVAAGALLLRSRGEPARILDRHGVPLADSISEKLWIDVNGVEQGMFIQGRDRSNPVLLFLHGGPGMPEYFLTEHYPTGLENDFTVAWWDQRGAGLSYRPGIAPETVTVEQLVSDTIAVSDYLRTRFAAERIYLMGHSGGSFIGIQAASRAPDRFHAYIGVAQMSFQLKSELLAHDHMLQQYRERGDRHMVGKLEAARPTLTGPLPQPYAALRDGAMHELGIGTTRDMRSVITGVFLPSWLSRQYTLGEKVNIWRGKVFSMRRLRDEMFATDLKRVVDDVPLPVYFVHGRYDYTCSYPEARAFFDSLKAPAKGFYTFEQSAHSPPFEEPERLRTILRDDVLRGVHTLADAAAEASPIQAR